MNTPNEDQDFNTAYNPFPEPQTIPAGWDYSALMSTPQVNSVIDEDNSAEG